MKHSTFRKSTLISSVALLLVAIVALSGATFAWFSSNDTTKANGINITASSASGLYIIESNSTTLPGAAQAWGSSVNFAVAKPDMAPASSNFATPADATFVKTITDRADGAYVAGTEIQNAIADTDYVVRHIWVKGDGTEATTLNATVTITSTGAFQGYERVAVIDADTGAFVGGSVIAPTDGEPAYYPLTAQGPDTTAITPIADGSKMDAATDWVPNTGKHLIVYCWFEGQDADCYNAKSGANLQFEINFELPKTEAQG